MVKLQTKIRDRRQITPIRLIALILSLLFAAGALIGCADSSAAPTGNTPSSDDETHRLTIFDAFDTVTTVLSRGLSKDEFDSAYAKIDTAIHRYDKLFTRFTIYPDIANVALMNERAATEPVTVDPEVYALMSESAHLAELTEGKYRPEMGAVIDLWYQAFIAAAADTDAAYLPDPEALREAARHSDAKSCKITPTGDTATVTYTDPDFLWDYGAMAKGYAVERIAAELEAEGVDYVLLSAGGNVRTIGRAPQGGWRVGIQDPFDNSDILGVIPVERGAVVTSGINQRYFVYEGKHYHHIVDPETLMPGDMYAAVTILGPDSGVADVLSTAIFNADRDATDRIMANFPEYEWLKVYPDGTIERSAGFPEFLEK